MANKQDTDISLLINDVEDDALVEELAEAGEFEDGQIIITPDDEGDLPFMPVGSIFVSAIPLSDARVHLLDGSTISQDGVYADFTNLIKSLVATGNNISCTQDQFNADVSATGNCGKFVIDNTNKTIRLPKITTFIQGLTDLSNIGHSIEAGLPNITGSLVSNPDSSNAGLDAPATGSGAISSTSKTSSGSNVDGTNWSVWGGFTFDASKSNAIYGKSSTVQPNATQFPYYIVLASGYKSSALVKIDNIATELNNILKKMYPVGSIYTSNDLSNNPMNILGFGTWERVKEQFILGAGDTYTNGATGGEAEHKLTTSEMPAHSHGPLYWNNGLSIGIGTGVSGNYYRVSSSTSGNTISTEAQTAGAGGSKAHNNMPPYRAVYMWQRVE